MVACQRTQRTSFEGEFGFGERGGALGSPAWVLCILKILGVALRQV